MLGVLASSGALRPAAASGAALATLAAALASGRGLASLVGAAADPRSCGWHQAPPWQTCSARRGGSGATSAAALRRRAVTGQQPPQQQQQRCFLTNPFAATPDSKVYKERRLIGYSPQQLYEVVAGVQHYAQFVPWCVGSHVLQRRADGSYLEAELQIGFQMISERYTSRVRLQPPHEVSSTVANSGLFHHLESTWQLRPGPRPDSTWLSFSVDFAFLNPLYANVAHLFFSEVVTRMMGAFEGRCRQLYGPPSFAAPGTLAAGAPRQQAQQLQARQARQAQQLQAAAPPPGQLSQQAAWPLQAAPADAGGCGPAHSVAAQHAGGSLHCSQPGLGQQQEQEEDRRRGG